MPIKQVFKDEGCAPVKIWADDLDIDGVTLKQLHDTSTLPFIHKHIAVMPDAHFGMGSTVGSVIPTIKAIIPAAVGVDIGCFSGDTKVILADSKAYRLDELAQNGKEVIIYSSTLTGKIVAAKATARLTRKNANLVKITLDSGAVIKCTPDHKFMLRDGTYAKDIASLNNEQSLMPFYSCFDKEGYYRIQQPYSGRFQRAHWLVARSGLMGLIPSFVGQKTIIHHRNFQKGDNNPNNLEFMGANDHTAYHRSLVENNLHWHSKEFEKARIAALRKKANTIEGKEYFAKRGTKNILKYMTEKRDQFLEAVSKNGIRGKKYLSAYNISNAGREKSKELSNRYNICPECGDPVRSYIGLFNHRRWKHKVFANHKIVSICPLLEQEDVYCLTVPEYENFALEAGVFVHNCGMMAHKLNLKASQLPDNLHALRTAIEVAVPHGRTNDGKKGDRGAWGEPRYTEAWERLRLDPRLVEVSERHPQALSKHGNAANHLGTLGTGNHFIEICTDAEADPNVWIMLHSGSRGIGNRLGTYFIQKAKEAMADWHISLADTNLAYLPEASPLFGDYWKAVSWAQDYARQNRELMMFAATQALEKTLELDVTTVLMAVNAHHNYCSLENHFGQNVYVTRKGAVRARVGDFGIIPGSMSTNSFIVRGKGNPESFHSCSHGAGRKMSRTEARKKFTVADAEEQTRGVECKKDSSIIDELPKAYKDVHSVMENQTDLVEIIATLKQVVCIKG
jgi:tRNA-splicing ligase RtcB